MSLTEVMEWMGSNDCCDDGSFLLDYTRFEKGIRQQPYRTYKFGDWLIREIGSKDFVVSWRKQ